MWFDIFIKPSVFHGLIGFFWQVRHLFHSEPKFCLVHKFDSSTVDSIYDFENYAIHYSPNF